MVKGEKIKWIEGTPLGFLIREIQYIAPHMHSEYIELTMCITGEIRFSYCFEEFTLREGEFLLVDKDIHYAYDGKDALCASFFIDPVYFTEKYPFIKSLILVCEGTNDSINPHDTYNHRCLKSIMLALLLFIADNKEVDENYKKIVNNATSKMVDLLVNKFDIMFWYNHELEISDKLFARYHLMVDYMYRHCDESISVGTIASRFGLSNAYVTELFRKYTLGFSKMLAYVRISHAEELLISTDMRLIEISEACHFSDPKYFYATFKYWYKCTPNQLRRTYLKKMQSENKVAYFDVADILTPLNSLIRHHLKDMFL
ncbi:MAG: helix-turn-helix transcriptional regulator [Clostridiales bacterium]|nr:helix-turn-helix transcriptional regulator [Clostridiales bacterium]